MKTNIGQCKLCGEDDKSRKAHVLSEKAIREPIYNLFIFLEGDAVSCFGAVSHLLEGRDSKKKAFLQRAVTEDVGKAKIYPIPHVRIREKLCLGSHQKVDHQMLVYLMRTGQELSLFEEVLRDMSAPLHPLFCITMVQDGEVRIDYRQAVEPAGADGEIFSSDFGGQIRKFDYLGKYTSSRGLDLDALFEDDFLCAIRILFENKLYVSAMKLLLSFIDTLAFLEYGNVLGNFSDWLEAYADLTPVGITAAQVWALRCGLLHMTNSYSHSVLKGNEPPLCFYGNAPDREIKWNHDDSIAMFSFEGLYDAVVGAVGAWATHYSGNLERQFRFVERYDLILSEGRLARLFV
jgi:hypothetical protein